MEVSDWRANHLPIFKSMRPKRVALYVISKNYFDILCSLALETHLQFKVYFSILCVGTAFMHILFLHTRYDA